MRLVVPSSRALRSLLPLVLSCSAGLARADVPVVSPATVDTLLEALAQDDTQGRDNLTPGADLARERLIDWLADQSFTPAGTMPGSFEQPFDEGANLLAIYYPAGTDGQPPSVLLGAHYDHVGSSCRARREAASRVCNGAGDNAGGVAAALAAMEAQVGNVTAPVAVALWDAEEDGRLGSGSFVEEPGFDLSGLKLYINLDIVGLSLFSGAEAVHFAIGAETGGAALVDDVEASGGGLEVQITRVSYALGRGRSDTDSFVDAGLALPFVFLSDGDGSVYHTTADELDYLNLGKVEAVANLAARLAARAADGPGYPYVPPPRVALPVYHDAVVIRDILRLFNQHARANALSSSQRAELAQRLRSMDAIVGGGEGGFGRGGAAQVAAAGLYALDLSADLPFVP